LEASILKKAAELDLTALQKQAEQKKQYFD
jgi:hypothetical protein